MWASIAAGGATLACGLFAGAALYITLVEHPARLKRGVAAGVEQFRHSYPRAAQLQAPLALAAAVLGLAAWLAGESIGWLAAGGLLGMVVPYTLIVVFPTNHGLLDASLDTGSPKAASLLHRWGQLHVLRTAASVAALGGMLSLLAS